MNKPVKPPHDDVAGPKARHETTQVMVGQVAVGGGAPIVVQSMTNTDTADIEGTIAQVAALSRAGSEMVRITVDRDEAAAAVPHIRDGLRKRGITTPLIGDFHYIGHKLLAEYPACAEALLELKPTSNGPTVEGIAWRGAGYQKKLGLGGKATITYCWITDYASVEDSTDYNV